MNSQAGGDGVSAKRPTGRPTLICATSTGTASGAPPGSGAGRTGAGTGQFDYPLEIVLEWTGYDPWYYLKLVL